MKESPILFSGPMVRAILDGKKTQTRRVVKNKDLIHGWDHDLGPYFEDEYGEYYSTAEVCPYGQVYDLLWVRETWCVHLQYDAIQPSHLPDKKYIQNAIVYMADVGGREKSTWMGKTRSSIHLPRRLSRITLEITDIIVERLQNISEDDAKAEGIKQEWTCINTGIGSYAHANNVIDDFHVLWDSINGEKHPWESNPWVWAIKFRQAT